MAALISMQQPKYIINTMRSYRSFTDSTVMKQLIVLFCLCIELTAPKKYEPTWDSLDSRPLPTWYDEAKVGIFIHWGVFSVPSFHSEWFWYYWKGDVKPDVVDYMTRHYPPDFTYQDFAREFTAEFFNPEEWVKLFEDAGARYIVLTTKHHEGYTLWPSKYSFSWNALDVGPRLDLVGLLATAVRKTNIKYGLYHSLYEWFNPLWIQDRDNNLTTSQFVDYKTLPELYELVNLYNPDIVWSDGEMEAPDTYWRSKEFLAWLYSYSTVKDTVVTNDRWGAGTACEHGDFYNCADRYSPGVLQPHKWENCITIDSQSWGYRRNARIEDFLTIEFMLQELTKTVSCGGNLLVNVAPTKDGIIPPIYQERLRQMGAWLAINGEAIYESKPWTFQNDSLTSGVWFTTNKEALFASVWNWPQNNILVLELPKLSQNSVINLLSVDQTLDWTVSGERVEIKFPDKNIVKTNWIYVLKMTNVLN